MGLKVSYHNLASPVRVKQNLGILATSEKLCVFIQSFVLNKCASASSSGLPENSGLKYDQFNCGIWAGGACSNIGLGTCAGGICWCTEIGICAEGFCGCNGFGTFTGGFCGCTGFGTCTRGFWGYTCFGKCAGGFWGCAGFGTCPGKFGGCTGFGTCTGGFCIYAGRFGSGGGSGMCAGGSGAGGSCGFGRAGFGIWSIGTITTLGSNGGFCCGRFFAFAFAWSVALVFIGFCFTGGLRAGRPLLAMSNLVQFLEYL